VLRVMTWNLDHWKQPLSQRSAAWDFLREASIDYALVQEAVPPEDLGPDRSVHRQGGIEGRGGWGSAVVSFSSPIAAITETRSPYGRGGKPVDVLA
jgi:hypothetical protein